MMDRLAGSARWIHTAFVALAAGIAPVTPAGAQGPATQELSARLDPETARTVRSLIDSATALGVPGEPLIAKALEGQSKGATGARIVLAVRNLSADLHGARQALGIGVTNFELVAAAGALRSGASTEVLTKLKSLLGAQSLLLPIATLTDLISHGVPVARAEAKVLSLAARGAGEADYRAQVGRAGRPGGAGAPASGVAPVPTIPRPAVPTVTAPISSPPGERPDMRP
jgi:hypothetical protein